MLSMSDIDALMSPLEECVTITAWHLLLRIVAERSRRFNDDVGIVLFAADSSDIDHVSNQKWYERIANKTGHAALFSLSAVIINTWGRIANRGDSGFVYYLVPCLLSFPSPLFCPSLVILSPVLDLLLSLPLGPLKPLGLSIVYHPSSIVEAAFNHKLKAEELTIFHFTLIDTSNETAIASIETLAQSVNKVMEKAFAQTVNVDMQGRRPSLFIFYHSSLPSQLLPLLPC